MDADLANRLRKASRESGDTHTEIVLAALDATHETLTFGLQEPSSSLFAGRGAPRPQRHTGPQVQIALRPRRDDLAVIDQLVERLNAPNRSALIAAALERHLPQ
jgi:hypothetical protein